MVEAREQFGFAVEAFGEGRIGGEGLRKNFQRHQAVQLGLAGFEDETHAALPDEFQNLQLRKGGGDFPDGRWRGASSGLAGFGGNGGGGEQAFGTKPLGRVCRERSLAFGAKFWFGCVVAHACYLSRRWPKVTRKILV